MRDTRKTLVLTAGREGGRWDVRQRITVKGSIQTPSFWMEGRDPKIRDKDLHYFRDHMPNFMKGKDIHHDWDNGAICYVLEEDKHHEKHFVNR
jgi:hypothetical protein